MPPARDREAPAGAREASGPLDARHLFGLAAADFGVFAVLLFPELHDGKQMKPAPYVELLVEVLMDVAYGGAPRLIVNLPPGHMKSLLISVLFTAWRLGKDPSLRILCISYGDDLAHQLSRLTRRVMQSRQYRKIFPGTILAKQAEDLLTTTKGGQRLATAVGGPAAGFRADLAIIDDPMQPDAAGSELKKQGLRDWYAGVVEQRMVPDGAIIVVMHRLAPDDFTATLVEGGGWFHIALPLVAVEAINYTNSYDRCFWSRRPGDLLSPGWTTPEAVATLRRTIVKEIFETQYQQNPQFGGTGVCSIDRLVRYAEPASRYELTIHSEAPIEISGFDLDEVDHILLDDEAEALEAGPLAPSPGAVAIARLGDDFQLGPHRIVCGDATDPAAYRPLFEDDALARLVLTDVPYNVKIAGNVTGGAHREFVQASGEMNDDEFLKFNVDQIGAATAWLVEGGVYGTFIDWRGLPTVHAAAEKLGLEPLNLIVWAKTNAGMGSLYRSQHELLPLFRKGDGPLVNNINLGRKGR